MIETTIEKLKNLQLWCLSVHLTINANRDYYESINEYLALRFDSDDIDPEIMAECIKNNQLVELHIYPTTPVGFYKFYHHDLSLCIDEAFDTICEALVLECDHKTRAEDE